MACLPPTGHMECWISYPPEVVAWILFLTVLLKYMTLYVKHPHVWEVGSWPACLCRINSHVLHVPEHYHKRGSILSALTLRSEHILPLTLFLVHTHTPVYNIPYVELHHLSILPGVLHPNKAHWSWIHFFKNLFSRSSQGYDSLSRELLNTGTVQRGFRLVHWGGGAPMHGCMDICVFCGSNIMLSTNAFLSSFILVKSMTSTLCVCH